MKNSILKKSKVKFFSSLIIFSSTMAFMHITLPQRESEGWEIIGAWFGNIILFLFFCVITILTLISVAFYRKIKGRKEKLLELMCPVFSRFLLPLFSFVLVIWSLFIIMDTVNLVFR